MGVVVADSGDGLMMAPPPRPVGVQHTPGRHRSLEQCSCGEFQRVLARPRTSVPGQGRERHPVTDVLHQVGMVATVEAPGGGCSVGSS